MKIICSKCGREIERTKKTPNAVCFNCKKVVRAEYNRKVKEGRIMVKRKIKDKPKVENPHESFFKYTKKLIINIPRRLTQKTIDYQNWLVRSYFTRQKCCHCERNLVFLCRKDNPYNVTSVCNNRSCCLFIDYRKIFTWKRIRNYIKY